MRARLHLRGLVTAMAEHDRPRGTTTDDGREHPELPRRLPGSSL